MTGYYHTGLSRKVGSIMLGSAVSSKKTAPAKRIDRTKIEPQSYMIFAFTYVNGRRAIQGDFSTSFMNASEMAKELSKEKKRIIVLNGVVLKYNGGNTPTGRRLDPIAQYENGKMRY